MTEQISDILTNNMHEVTFDGYAPYAVLLSAPQDDKNVRHYPFTQTSDSSKHVSSSACWRGCISVYELTPAGELHRVKFVYPDDGTPSAPDDTHERLTGDFWLELRKGFEDEKLYVPFRDGNIVLDNRQWVTVCPQPVSPRWLSVVAMRGLWLGSALLALYAAFS